MKELNKQQNNTSLLALITLSLKRALGRVVEYPVHNIRTRNESKPQWSVLDTISHTKKNFGYRGFYAGFLPHTARSFPLICLTLSVLTDLPSRYKAVLSPYYSGLPLMLSSNLASAFTLAVVGTPLIAPFETYRLHRIVSPNPLSLLSYMKSITPTKHFMGSQTVFMKGFSSWTAYLLNVNLGRNYCKKQSPESTLNWRDCCFISSHTAISTATCVSPWDVARTQLQTNPFLQRQSLGNIIRWLYTHLGAKALFAAWSIRFAQSFIGTMLYLPILEDYENNNSHLLQP